MVSWWLVLVGLGAFVALLGYSGGPRPYASAGLGELFVFIFFGLIATLGSSYVQHRTLPATAWIAAVVTGLLAVAILVVNNLRDVPTDAIAGKRTLAVRVGEARTRQLFVTAIAVGVLLAVDRGADRSAVRVATSGDPGRAARPRAGQRSPGRRGGSRADPRARWDRQARAGGRGAARRGASSRVRTHTYDIAMRVRFRGQERRRGMLLNGPAGWGEFSPFPDYDAVVASRWLAAAHEAANDGWPAPLRTRILVNTTVPAVGPEQAHAMVSASGCSTAKVKVAEPGQTLAEDIARVEAVRDALGPTGLVRVDANAGWSLEEAVTALTELSRFSLEYAEQPVASLADMAAFRRRVDVRLAADESVRNAEDPLRIAGLEAADIVILKVQPLGGVRACLAVAEACGLPVVVSSAVETSVGHRRWARARRRIARAALCLRARHDVAAGR